ncbi:enoyl-CoA-hydratase DpgB [Nonomuraea sp. B12E4]|uniref:enoyl-CoA-hydratase DpgB n=1 Tax=Nonomuraea sp. B12E4 TaxID=3153564 RepID=UPI00325CE2B6
MTISGAEPLSAATVEAIGALVAEAERQEGGTVAIRVSGAPRGAWTRELNVSLVTRWERMLRRLERLPVTTVALASGDCGGAALDVLLTTDVRIGETGVRLLIAGDGEATWPGMALYRLAQQAGVARTRRAALFGRPITAAEALELGLLDEVTEDPQEALAAAGRGAGPLAGSELAIRRRLMFDATTTVFEDALGAHLAACDRALRRTEVAR